MIFAHLKVSNEINDIKFDENLGLAYIATKLGVSKFKIPFASEIDKVDQIDIFPSPFRIPSIYPLIINGVPEQSSIQIMTLNGTIVKTIDSNEINDLSVRCYKNDKKNFSQG